MALEFLERLGFIEDKSDLRGGQLLDAQQVAEAFCHFGSSDIFACCGTRSGSAAQLFHALDEHHALFVIHFLQPNFYNLAAAGLHSSAHEAGFNGQFAMASID